MNFFTDYDRYTFADEMDFFYHDDGAHSVARRKEMDLRRYAGLDTYCGDYEDFYSSICQSKSQFTIKTSSSSVYFVPNELEELVGLKKKVSRFSSPLQTYEHFCSSL